MELISMFLGSGFTLIGIFVAHYLNIRNEEKSRRQQVMALLKSLHNEINTLWSLYLKGVGSELERLPDGGMLAVYYPITQEYFTIYRSNANLIALIDDDALKQQIIKVYAKAAGLLDSFRMNNDLTQKHETTSWLFNEGKTPERLQMAHAYQNSLVEYAKSLKESHYDMKAEIAVFNQMISKYKFEDK